MVKKIVTGYLKLVETVCITLLFLIFVLMVVQVACRLLSIGQNFTEEMARIAFCLMVFFGAPLALAEGADICVDMLVNKLPAGVQKVTNILADGLTAVFSVLWIYTIMLVSFGFLFLVAVGKAIALILNKKDTIDINAEEKALARKEESEMNLGI